MNGCTEAENASPQLFNRGAVEKAGTLVQMRESIDSSTTIPEIVASQSLQLEFFHSCTCEKKESRGDKHDSAHDPQKVID